MKTNLRNSLTIVLFSFLFLSENSHGFHGEASIDLKGLVDAAWDHSGLAKAASLREQALQQKSSLARQLFPKSGEVGVSFESDEPFRDEGQREYNLSYETPVWLPGQKKAMAKIIETELDVLQTENQLKRWELAAEVRNTYWDVMLARIDLNLAERKVSINQKLVINVKKRVNAGELAEIDLLLSEQRLLDAERSLLAARQTLSHVHLSFQGLTGREAPEDWLSEDELSLAITDHPILVVLENRLAFSSAELDKIRTEKRESPKVGLELIRERDDRHEDYQDAIGIEFNLPLGNRALNKSAFFEAEARKSDIEAAYILERTKLEQKIESARQAVEHAKKSYELAERLKSLAVQHYKLIQGAFEVGEVGLRELLLVQNESDQAVEGSARQRVELARTVSRMNQEQGDAF